MKYKTFYRYSRNKNKGSNTIWGRGNIGNTSGIQRTFD